MVRVSITSEFIGSLDFSLFLWYPCLVPVRLFPRPSRIDVITRFGDVLRTNTFSLRPRDPKQVERDVN